MAKTVRGAKVKPAPKKTIPKKGKGQRKAEILEPEVIDANTLLPVADDELKIPAIEKGLVSSDPVTRYLTEIRRYPLLTREEEYALAVRYREKGDREAAQKLVTSNLRFVVKVAAEYSKFGARMIDLIQEGNMGLMQAVKDFNPYKGVRLITYAVWWIRGQIQDHLMRHYSMVRIGTTAKQRKLFYELQRQKDQLEKMGFEAGIAQLSGRLGIPNDEVKAMGNRVLGRDVSLNAPATADGTGTLIDLQADHSEVMPDEQVNHAEELSLLKEHIDRIRPSLNERELYILDKRLLADDPVTLQDFGDKYGVTREAARQLEARLIEKIKKQMLPE
jgi:RNA polymerase sigma-32 factor